MKNMLNLFVFLFCFASFFSMAQADSPKMKALETEMNLTQDQHKKIKEIKQKYSEKIKKLKAVTCENRFAMQQAFRSAQKGESFQKELQEKFMQFRVSKNEERLEQFKMALEIREILNTEQIVKFNEIHSSGGPQNLQQCLGE